MRKSRPPRTGSGAVSEEKSEAVTGPDLEGPRREQDRARVAEVGVRTGRRAGAAVEATVVLEVEHIDGVDVDLNLSTAPDGQVLGQTQVQIAIGEGVRNKELLLLRIGAVRAVDEGRTRAVEHVERRARTQGQ